VKNILLSKISIFVLIILISVFLSFTLTISYISKLSQNDTSYILQNQLRNTLQAIETWGNKTSEKIKWLQNDPEAVELVMRISKLKSNSRSQLKEQPLQIEINKYFENIIKSIGYKGFFVVSKKYKNLSSSRASNIGVENLLKEDKHFWNKIWDGKIALSSIVKSDVPIKNSKGEFIDKAINIFVGGPIYDKKRRIVSALLLRIDPYESYFKVFTAGQIGNSGETYAVNNNFKMTTLSRFNNHLINIGFLKRDQNSVLNIEIKEPPCNMLHQKCKYNLTELQPTLAIRSCKKEEIGLNTVGYKDYRGVTVVGTWKWSKMLHACIITEIDQEEAYATLNTIKKVMWTLAILISLIITIIIVFYAKIREKTEQERIQKRLASTEKLASLGEMAGALAHEINTPLSAIILNLDEFNYLISNKKIQDEAATELITEILDSANSISKIVLGIKGFSRQGENDTFVKINIWNVIKESLSICENNLKLHSISVQIPKGPIPIYTQGSPSALMQVFVNLFNNAKDAIKDSSGERWISIDVKEMNNKVSILFIDSGNGIPQEVRHKIFDPFFTTKDIGDGTGLGLGISHNIIESHRGEIKIDDDHENTCFTIELPLIS